MALADAGGGGAHHLLVQGAVVEVRHGAQLGPELPQAPGQRQGDQDPGAEPRGRSAVPGWLAGTCGTGAEDPGVSSSTMVTAHHDAESSDRCLIALQDPEELLVRAEQERGVAGGEDGAPTGRVLQHAVGGAAEGDDPGP